MRTKMAAAMCLLMFLGGCYDYRETDDMAIVSGLHIAKGGEKNCRLTFEIVGTDSEDGSARVQLIEKEGQTVAQAIDNATALSGKRLYFDHAQILAIDYALAQEGIGDILDYFTRQNDMRLSMKLIVSKGMTGSELFESDSGEVRSFVLSDMLRANEERTITPDVQLYSFVRDSAERGKDSFLPVVNMGKDGKITLDSTALFKKARLTGELNGEESKYFMMLNNIGERGGFILERQEESPVSFEIRSRKATVKPRLEGGRLVCEVEFEAQLGVLELIGDAEVLEGEKLMEMEEELEKYVFEQLHGTLRKISRNNMADVLGTEAGLIKKHPGLSEISDESFERLYRDAHFDLTVKVSVIDSGRTLRKLRIS